MRSFSTILPQFWTGSTGRAITKSGKDTRIVSMYSLTCEHANMIGLYRLPLLYMSEETGLKRREILAALDQLRSLDFAAYDLDTEFVWVYEMARFQLDLSPHEPIKEGDHRAQGAARLYKQLPSNPFLLPFYERYVEILRLPLCRDFLAEKKPLGSPLGGPSKLLGRVHGPGPDPDLVLKGDTGETKISTLPSSEMTPEKISQLWNQIPGVKPCKKIEGALLDRVKRLIKDHPPDWWIGLLSEIEKSNFLCGRAAGRDGRKPFRADLDWVTGPINLGKILSGKYDDRTTQPPQRQVINATMGPAEPPPADVVDRLRRIGIKIPGVTTAEGNA